MNKTRFTTYLPPELKEALGKAAKENGCSESYIVSRALKRYLDDPKTKEGGE